MDLCCSKLSPDSEYLTRLRDQEHSLVECLNVMEHELSQLNNVMEYELSKLNIKESDALQHGCNEEVEINDKLLESIKTFEKVFTNRQIRDYILFTYDQVTWLKSLDLSCCNYYPNNLSRFIDNSMSNLFSSNMLELNALSAWKVVVTYLSCQLKDDSHVGPYRIRKQDLPGFSYLVKKILECTDKRLSSIEQALG